MEENMKRILVVDDEQDLCEILKFNLETEGYEVETANSAEEALEMDIASFDLLLLDVMMGGMSGFQLAKQLKGNPMTANVPIIFLTARDTENDTVTGFNIGADDYISKPFSIREVMVRVRAVLRRTAEQAGDADESKIINYQGLQLNLDKKTVSIDGEAIPFTKTEFELGLGERDCLTIDAHRLLVQIQLQSLIVDDLRFISITSLFSRTAQDGTHSDHHLSDRERFRDIIIGTDIESCHRIIFRISGCKEDNRNIGCHRIALQLLSQLETAHSSHHDVQ